MRSCVCATRTTAHPSRPSSPSSTTSLLRSNSPRKSELNSIGSNSPRNFELNSVRCGVRDVPERHGWWTCQRTLVVATWTVGEAPPEASVADGRTWRNVQRYEESWWMAQGTNQTRGWCVELERDGNLSQSFPRTHPSEMRRAPTEIQLRKGMLSDPSFPIRTRA